MSNNKAKLVKVNEYGAITAKYEAEFFLHWWLYICPIYTPRRCGIR